MSQPETGPLYMRMPYAIMMRTQAVTVEGMVVMMRIRRGVAALVGVLSVVGAVLVAGPPGAAAAGGPVFTVMNTSETPPDGVWFRRSPHTADTDGITGHGVYRGERVELECYAWGDSVGQYNDKLWYYALNVSRPTNGGVTNQGFLNAHYINDGKAANVVDAGVPDCSAPKSEPTVSLAQGEPAPAGYRYAITLDHFAANSGVSVTCYDSVSTSGFYTFTLTTDAAGHAFSQSYCYSGDGPDHWVVAGGTTSNHVTWSGGSSGGGGGGTSTAPTSPRPTAPLVRPTINLPKDERPKPASRPRPRGVNNLQREFVALIDGCYWKEWDNCYLLGNHYLDRSGTDYWIDMSDLLDEQTPLAAVEQWRLRDLVRSAAGSASSLPAAGSKTVRFGSGWQQYGDTGNNDWHFAVGHFSVALTGDIWFGPEGSFGNRSVQIRYKMYMYDVYNFDGKGRLGRFLKLRTEGRASEFWVYGETRTVTVQTNNNFSASGLRLEW